jgi:hypothetical protein
LNRDPIQMYTREWGRRRNEPQKENNSLSLFSHQIAVFFNRFHLLVFTKYEKQKKRAARATDLFILSFSDLSRRHFPNTFTKKMFLFLSLFYSLSCHQRSYNLHQPFKLLSLLVSFFPSFPFLSSFFWTRKYIQDIMDHDDVLVNETF